MNTLDTNKIVGPWVFGSLQAEAERHLESMNTLDRTYTARQIAAHMLYNEPPCGITVKVEHYMFWQTGIMCSVEDIKKACQMMASK